MSQKNEATDVDVLAVMVRDATDAQKFRAGNQHAFPHSVRVGYRRESDNSRAAVAALISREAAYRNALEHIAGSCEGRAAEVASTALKDAEASHGG